MKELTQTEKSFLEKITVIIEEHISEEKFGVLELANEVGMSRSNLLRKVQKITNLSVSQFIRQIRLQHAMDMLKTEEFTVSEISYKVGFGSVSYFIKCFREYYGFPPGEAGEKTKAEQSTPSKTKPTKKSRIILAALISICVLIAVIFILNSKNKNIQKTDKSIAVLPFKNDSNDSTNVYIVNGLMEAILSNLQKIEDLRVISRTSVEKYRNTNKTIPEIAKELNVSYFVEGSGQKIGDKILLNIQLIEAASDKHLWAEQYDKETKDIFTLQKDVAKNIAGEIQVIITPEEEKRINKAPTDNLEAYDLLLKGIESMRKETYDGLEEAVIYFDKAIKLDNEFALAYALTSISYYYMEIYRTEKQHTEKVNYYADKALFFDPQLPEALTAKALYYYNIQEYAEAEPFLKKALDYNPNSVMILNLLSDFYTSYIPNTKKYLEYALKGINLDIASNDSSDASFVYLHISNALIQSGFVEEALEYINKSLDYNPNNIYSDYVKAYILYAKTGNLKKTKERLVNTYKKDTSRLDVIQETANICYYMRDYEEAYRYYRKLVDLRKQLNMRVFIHKDLQIGYVFEKMGQKEEAKQLMKNFLNYAENDNSIYKHAHLALYYSYTGKVDKALHHLKLFSEEKNYHYWILLMLSNEPLFDNIKNEPGFKKAIKKLENKFWDNHKEIKEKLKTENLI